jgi:hypothetical protein
VTAVAYSWFRKIRILSDIDLGGALPCWNEYFSGGRCLDDLNRYAYCRNNPVRYLDPTGYLPEDFYEAMWQNQSADEQAALGDKETHDAIVEAETTGEAVEIIETTVTTAQVEEALKNGDTKKAADLLASHQARRTVRETGRSGDYEYCKNVLYDYYYISLLPPGNNHLPELHVGVSGACLRYGKVIDFNIETFTWEISTEWSSTTILSGSVDISFGDGEFETYVGVKLISIGILWDVNDKGGVDCTGWAIHIGPQGYSLPVGIDMSPK